MQIFNYVARALSKIKKKILIIRLHIEKKTPLMSETFYRVLNFLVFNCDMLSEAK